jgi:hypothetical protein
MTRLTASSGRTAYRRANGRRSSVASLRGLLRQISATGAAAYRLSERPRDGSTTCCLPNSRASKEYPPGPSKQSTMASMFAHRCRTSMRSPLNAHGAIPHATVAAAANGVSNPSDTRIPIVTLTGSTHGGIRNSGLTSAPCKSAAANAIRKSSIATPGRPRGKMENSRCTSECYEPACKPEIPIQGLTDLHFRVTTARPTVLVPHIGAGLSWDRARSSMTR